MKKSFVTILLGILSILSAFSQSSEPPKSSESRAQLLIEHYEAIQSLYPRLEGSSGEDRALSYIENVAAEHELDVSFRDFSDMERAHSFSRNARVDLPGTQRGRVFVLVPLNHDVEQAPHNDHSISLAAALAIMEEEALRSNRPSLSFVFLGAESDQRTLGTQLLLESTAAEDANALLYLDVGTAGGKIAVELGADGNAAPRRLAEGVVRTLFASGLPHRQYPTSLQVSRSRLAGGSVLSAYLEQQLPAVRIHDRIPGPAGLEPTQETEPSNEWASAFVSFLSDTINQVPSSDSTNWDQHYIYGRTGDMIMFLGEETYLVLLLIVLSSPLVYGLVFQRRLRRYLRLVTHNIWSLLVLLILMFFFFFVATALIRAIFELRDFPTLWQYAPGPYFLLKLLLSVFLFAFMFQSLKGLPFPRRGSFYSASAIFLLFLDIILLSLFNISFTFYFLWALVGAFLFSLARWVWLKAVLLLASPLWIIIGVVELFAAGKMEAQEALLLSPVAGNLIFAVVLLPFLLMLIRVDLMLHHHFSFPRGTTLRITVLGSAAAVVLFAAGLVFLEPFDEQNPQPVEAVQVVDNEAKTQTLELKSPAPLEGLVIRVGSQRYPVDTEERSYRIEMPGEPDILSVAEDQREFLSRSQVVLTIDSSLAPERIEVSLQSEEELLIYDSAFPYERRGERQVEFAVGRFPPNPLRLPFTVPGESETSIHVRLHSRETPEEIESTEEAFRLETRTRVLHKVSQ